MAAPSHRKLSRKELKQPDEFLTALEWAGDFAVTHLRQLILGVLAVAVVVAGVLLFSFYEQHQNLLASDQFYSAINALNDKQYATARQDLGALAENRSASSLGKLAPLYLASADLAQDQPARARDQLHVYLMHAGNNQFRQLALVQLGVAEETLRDYREAHSAYLEAARLPGPERTRAQVSAARTLALIGDRKGAIDAYQRFLQDNPYAQQAPEVIEALAQMGAAPRDNRPAAVGSQVPVRSSNR